MRPIRLKMSAFGVYVKTTELDFEVGLNGENFFLIHGATGSGKTTILDAICYALYGESSGGGRKGSMMRSEQAFPTEKTEVDFTFALHGKIYRIVRNPKYMRARIRGGGLTEEKAAAEIFENGRRLETKDVSEYVRGLLKFDSEQFRQVVMLPQGAFQKFLMAKSDARQVVLNMLFDADFFKRVEDELKIKAADAKKIYDSLIERKNHYLEEVDGSEEELPTLIKKIADDLDASQVKLKTLEAQALAAQKNFSDGENLSKRFKDLNAKSQEADNAEKLLRKILAELQAAKIEFEKRTEEEPRRKELERLAAELGKKKIALRDLQVKRGELKEALKKAQEASTKLDACKEYKLRCDKRMADIKAEELKLLDAPAKLEVAKHRLQAAKDRENLLRQISTAEKNFAEATKNHDEAERYLSDLRERQLSGSAARLAKTLQEGTPCPVCGSIHHPSPATSTEQIPTDAQIKAADSRLKSLSKQKEAAAKNLAGLKSTLESKEKDLAKFNEAVTVAEAQAAFEKISADVKELERCRTRIKNGEDKIREADAALDKANAEVKKTSDSAKILQGSVDNMEQTIEKKYTENPTLLDEEFSSTNKALDELNTLFKKAQENFNRLNNKAAAQKATVAAAQKNKADLSAQLEGKTLPEMNALKKLRDETQAAWKASVEAKTKLSEQLERLKVIAKNISDLADKLKVADKNFLMWKTLSDAASGKISRISFQRYYLATMFKEVIAEANNRLEKMSGGRYRFQNKTEVTDRRFSGGLDLEIVDDYSGSARPVETLSGGESFLASLSLALGLAAVVQNNAGGIKLDTIFIDEGFGSLDSETLDFAMKTLIELQSGGRLVGIISHVEELKHQMPVRLEVKKIKTGSTAEFIH